MIGILMSSVVFATLCHHGFSQETTAQSICDAKSTVGLYSNPDDTTCKQYAKCFNSSSTIVGAFYNCTGSTFFNPNLQLCSTTYTCPEAATTEATTTETTTTETTTATTTETTTRTTTSAPTSAQSICDSEGVAGRYPNPDDITCKQYVDCFASNSLLVGSYYNCTGTTLFNPSLQQCANGYQCSS